MAIAAGVAANVAVGVTVGVAVGVYAITVACADNIVHITYVLAAESY